ncbi:outer membrane beta-barrel domain-containing protein [Marinibactrum halimedae]|uniref:Outer membrane beta-barrel domain-containing protein n=1 Tax=Marinibactrum halimedae TaxID=1444977 RepID=A0AA37WP14_9GAMM|nr:outer membrane beta-barrel domain-containing protein [Marinibactrum halimedae]MCD9457428.1 outer membrane beta-barrel domain-containing protein [Marinibactrum halimedae]GLS25522.1 hypothetical protein GCM10007877_12360 [Marinibactrum halimedae]
MLRWTRIQRLLPVTLGLLLFQSANSFAQTSPDVTIIEPSKKVDTVKYAALDDEQFEFGISVGSLSIEDFGNSAVTTFKFAYHVTPKWMTQFEYGRSEVGVASFEEVVNNRFLSDEDRRFTYTNLTLGYRALYGRSFFGGKNRFNSNIYLNAGVENIDFAGQSNTGLVIGTTYKTVLTDWLTLNLDLKNHIFEREFLNDEKLTQNIEFGVGAMIMF